MGTRQITREILAFANRITEARYTTGDLLRLPLGFVLPRRNTSEKFSPSSEIADTLDRLWEAAVGWYKESDPTYQMICEQINLIRYGVLSGRLDERFFAALR